MNFGSLSWLWRCKEHPCPLSPHLGLWRTLEVPDWGLASWSWFGYGHWSLIYPWSEFWLSILILKVQRTSMSFKSSFGALEDAGGSWLGFGILILIWIWSLVFDIPMIRILALYLDFEGAKNIHILEVLIWGFGGRWTFLTGVWHPDIDLDMVTGLWYTHIPSFGSLSWFGGAKNLHILLVLIWVFGGGWRFMIGGWHLDLDLDMVACLWYTHVQNFGSLFWFKGAKNIYVL